MIADIVYQHQDWMIIDKPEGHSVQALSEHFSERFPHFHPVHRLDKDTSGLWLIALNKNANQQLSRAFQEREVYKTYLAVTHKKPKKKQGVIKGDMIRSRRSQWQLSKATDNPAVTHFHSVGMKDGKRLVLCSPVTGKTHQIRVAMKSIGSPILGDVIYDKQSAKAFERLYLHAYSLSFEWNDQQYNFQLEPTSGSWFADDAYYKAIANFQNPFSVDEA